MDDKMIDKLIHALSTILICLCYVHFVSSRIPKGLFRFISLLPILCIFSILPLHLPPAVYPVAIISSLAWLAIFKIILFAFGKGPLSTPEEQQLCKFILHATIPLRNPSSKSPDLARKSPNLGLKVLVLAVDIAIIAKYRQEIHPQILGLCIILGLDCCWTLLSKLVFHALGLELEPLFDTPYLSTSLQNLWSRRWNLIVTNLLGQIVYIPVRSALHRELAKAPAIFATFLVSGLWHEVLYYYATRKNPSWEMTAYFVLHGICVILEVAVKKACKGRLHFPAMVSVPITVGFWIVTGLWLIMLPAVRDGIDTMAIREIRFVMDFFLALFKY